MTKYKFPENFWWGSAASGPQTEGRIQGDHKGENIWDYWYEQEPEKFFNQVGPEKTSQFYTKYREDVQLMKKTGHNTFRTSIQWSRLLPNGTGEVNQTAVAFYRAYFKELLDNGIEPFVNLYHFDMPLTLQKNGGWLDRKTVDAYVDYATTCFDLFGDLVKKWFTHNEPIVPVEGGYLYQFHYPNHVNMKEAIQVGYHENLASAKAIKAYHQLKAATIADAFFNRSFLDPAVKGEFPQDLIKIVKELDLLPEIKEGDLETIKENTVDLLGINYYQPRRVKAKETPIDHTNGPLPDDYFDNYDKPDKKMNPYRGWEIYEKGIYDILTNTRENYGNIKCYISENGMGVEGEKRFINENGVIEDDYRIEFVTDHLKYVHQAIEEGTNCVGYHMWTCMDNWSWTNAYKNRYGFIAVDLAQDGKRTIKKSGHWFSEVAKNNGF